jgi:hypothetical protein
MKQVKTTSTSSKLLVVLASTVNLVFESHRNPWPYFSSFQTFTSFEKVPPLRGQEGSDYHWRLPLYWGFTFPFRQSSSCHLFHACFLLDLLFNIKYGGAMFLRNVGWLFTDYMALFLRRQNSSYPPYIERHLYRLQRLGLSTHSISNLYL